MLEQRAVTALLELEKTSSFKIAAERLGISQPTFTRLIQKVEREYGLTIFYRASAGVRPTLEGIRFLEVCRDYLEFSKQYQKRAIDVASGAEQIRIVTGPLAAPKLHGLPPSRVLGTSLRSEWLVQNDKPLLVRGYRLEHLNNWDGKPRLIQNVIGKPPIFAAGNSNGDQQMLQYAALSCGIALLVHHADGEREFAYTKHTDKVMPLAQK